VGAIQVMLQHKGEEILKGLRLVCKKVKMNENLAITMLVSSAKNSHMKALRNQINELKDTKWDEPSAVQGRPCPQTGRNEAARASGTHHSERRILVLPKDRSLSFLS